MGPYHQQQQLITELSKIEMRILYMRHVTRRITAPDVVERLPDYTLLYASLHSLNQLIDVFSLQHDEFADAVERANSVTLAVAMAEDDSNGLVTLDFEERVAGLLADMQQVREELAEQVINADMILDCFTNEARL